MTGTLTDGSCLNAWQLPECLNGLLPCAFELAKRTHAQSAGVGLLLRLSRLLAS